MFRYFESLVDPYAPYAENDTPPDRLWPFLRDYLRPARRVMAWTVALGPRGRGDRDLADLVRRPAGRRARRHAAGRGLGAPRARARAGRALHPARCGRLIQTLSAALLNQSLMPNVGTIVRWRSHRHVLRQSVGWFQNDFAGRIANRMMQTAPGGRRGDVPDLRRAGLCGDLPRRRALAARRHRPAAGAAARRLARALRLAGRLDGAAGRQGVEGVLRRPLGDHRADRRQLHQHPVGEALRPHPRPRRPTPARRSSTRARPSSAQMRIITLMDLGLTVINGFLIVAVIGYAIVLWQQGARDGRHRRGRLGADAAAERDDRLDHVVAVVALPERRRDPRGHGDDRPADRAAPTPPARASSRSRRGEIVLDRVSHHYGRGSGRPARGRR